MQLHDAIFLQHSDGVGNRVFANPIDQIWLQAGTAFDYGNNAYFVDPHAALGLTISLILLGLISAGAVLLGAPRGLRSLFIVGWLATVVACSIACMVRSGIQYDPLYASSRTNATLSDGLTYGAQAGVVIGLLVGFLLILVSGVADRVVNGIQSILPAEWQWAMAWPLSMIRVAAPKS